VFVASPILMGFGPSLEHDSEEAAA
jgi:hypothetical protein